MCIVLPATLRVSQDIYSIVIDVERDGITVIQHHLQSLLGFKADPISTVWLGSFVSKVPRDFKTAVWFIHLNWNVLLVFDKNKHTLYDLQCPEALHSCLSFLSSSLSHFLFGFFLAIVFNITPTFVLTHLSFPVCILTYFFSERSEQVDKINILKSPEINMLDFFLIFEVFHIKGCSLFNIWCTCLTISGHRYAGKKKQLACNTPKVAMANLVIVKRGCQVLRNRKRMWLDQFPFWIEWIWLKIIIKLKYNFGTMFCTKYNFGTMDRYRLQWLVRTTAVPSHPILQITAINITGIIEGTSK